MEESILLTIRNLIGPSVTYDIFDPALIVHINTVLMILRELGIGPANGFRITGTNETWSDFLGSDRVDLEAVKTYVYLRVKVLFDPPSSSFVLNSMKEQADELTWRLNVAVDPKEVGE